VRGGQLAALELLPDVDEEVEVDDDEEEGELDELSLAGDEEPFDEELSDDEAAFRLSVR
jgi:hypothetical protein